MSEAAERKKLVKTCAYEAAIFVDYFLPL